jgi:tetratricopeptide (TPR) repeat protein
VYLLASLRDLPSPRFPWWPASVLGVLVALHLMTVTLLPSLVLLAAVRTQGAELRLRGGSRAAAGASALAAVALAATVAWVLFRALDFDIVGYLRATREGRLLPLFSDPTFFQAYRMFSWRHLFDVANQYMLVAPAAVMGALLLRRRRADARQVFLAVAAVPPLLFTIVANPEVGPFRDWDVFSFAAPLALLWVGTSLGLLLRNAQELGHVAILLVGGAALHALAWIAVNADAAAAEARFVRLLERCPVSAHAAAYGWETLSIHHEVAKRPEDAVRSLERAIRANPANPRYWRKVGELHVEAGRDAEARRCLERALELDPNLVDAWLALGIVYYRANELAEAAALFERVVARREADAAAWYNLGLCRSRQGDPGEALRCFRSAVEAKPDFADAQYQLAALLRELGDVGAARAAFARQLELEPEGPRAEEIRRWLAETD